MVKLLDREKFRLGKIFQSKYETGRKIVSFIYVLSEVTINMIEERPESVAARTGGAFLFKENQCAQAKHV